MTKEELEKENAELKKDKQNLRADLRTARNNLQAKDTAYQLAMEELNYAKTHCLFHSDCPTQKENTELKAELKAIDEAGEHARKQITESFRNKKPYWELEKENAELKDKLKALEGQTKWEDIKNSIRDNINIVTDTE